MTRRSFWMLALLLPALGSRVWAQAPGLNIQADGGGVNLSITGVLHTACAVQCTASLAPTNSWQLLTNLVLAANPCVVTDPSLPAAGQRFYRVMVTHPALTVTDAQLQDMCSRTCDYLAANSRIPETVTVGGPDTNAVTAAEFHYLMTKWLRHYRTNSVPPTTVAITRGASGPAAPIGVEIGTIYLADILAAAAAGASYIDSHHTLPDCSVVGGTPYTTRAMLWLFARTINWYQDHASTMPNFATVRAVTGPGSWVEPPPPGGTRVAVFTDPDGGSTSANCVNATIAILSTNSGFSVSTITGASIRAGALTNYDLVMFPGGSGAGQAGALQQAGCQKVEQFVAAGGGYVGTCAGAFLPVLGYTLGGNSSTEWLNIVDAEIIDLEHWGRGTGLAEVRIVNRTHPIVAGFPENITAEYFNGPLLGPGGSPAIPDYEEIAVYVSDIHDNAPAGIMPGTTAMTTSTYQLGRCVLFSFHPELSPGLEQMVVRGVKWAAGEL